VRDEPVPGVEGEPKLFRSRASRQKVSRREGEAGLRGRQILDPRRVDRTAAPAIRSVAPREAAAVDLRERPGVLHPSDLVDRIEVEARDRDPLGGRFERALEDRVGIRGLREEMRLALPRRQSLGEAGGACAGSERLHRESDGRGREQDLGPEGKHGRKSTVPDSPSSLSVRLDRSRRTEQGRSASRKGKGPRDPGASGFVRAGPLTTSTPRG
jgi:hypothetical protein